MVNEWLTMPGGLDCCIILKWTILLSNILTWWKLGGCYPVFFLGACSLCHPSNPVFLYTCRWWTWKTKRPSSFSSTIPCSLFSFAFPFILSVINFLQYFTPLVFLDKCNLYVIGTIRFIHTKHKPKHKEVWMCNFISKLVMDCTLSVYFHWL